MDCDNKLARALGNQPGREAGGVSGMAFRQVLSGCVMVCALAAVSASALAEPFPGAQQYAKLEAPAFGTVPQSFDPSLPVVEANLNESVIEVPSGDVSLETTIFKPDGPGPFPMVVFNHGKLPGNAHDHRERTRAIRLRWW